MKRKLGFAAAAVVILCVGWFGVVVILADGDFTNLGRLGDSFGVLSALFSGLAFAAVVYALLLQTEELRALREMVTLEQWRTKPRLSVREVQEPDHETRLLIENHLAHPVLDVGIIVGVSQFEKCCTVLESGKSHDVTRQVYEHRHLGGSPTRLESFEVTFTADGVPVCQKFQRTHAGWVSGLPR